MRSALSARRARRRAARSRASTRSAICAASAGVMSPRATAARTVASTCRRSSTVRNDDRSIPRRAAGSMAVSGGGKSCAARCRNRCGLRSSRSDSAGAPSCRAARSGTRRLGLGMPRGRPSGLPELLCCETPARVAREAERDQAQVIEIPGIEAWGTGGYRRTQADRQRFPSSAGLRGERGRTYGFIIRSHQVPQLGHAARIQIG